MASVTFGTPVRAHPFIPRGVSTGDCSHFLRHWNDGVEIKFTVKTRIGFDSPEVFDELLPIFAKRSLDMLAVHGRTVFEGYRPTVHYDFIARAVAEVPCPVLANGNVDSPQSAGRIKS